MTAPYLSSISLWSSISTLSFYWCISTISTSVAQLLLYRSLSSQSLCTVFQLSLSLCLNQPTPSLYCLPHAEVSWFTVFHNDPAAFQCGRVPDSNPLFSVYPWAIPYLFLSLYPSSFCPCTTALSISLASYHNICTTRDKWILMAQIRAKLSQD